MAKNHFYWGIKKAAAMPQVAWTRLINILEGIPQIPAVLDDEGNVLVPEVPGTSAYLYGTSDRRENTFQVIHNLLVPFDAAIYEANFDDSNVSLELIRQKLVNAANVADNRITFTTTQQTFDTVPSPIVAYRLDGTIMFRASIFAGLNSTWEQSRIECVKYEAINSAEWNEQ